MRIIFMRSNRVNMNPNKPRSLKIMDPCRRVTIRQYVRDYLFINTEYFLEIQPFLPFWYSISNQSLPS